jgi:peptide/nickel transport system permease protein
MTTVSSANPVIEELASPEAPSQWSLVVRRFRRHRIAMASLAILLIIFVASLLAPWITPFSYRETNLAGGQYLPPLSAHPQTGQLHLLGTDNLGRDVFSRLLFAARTSLTVALLVTGISSVIGVVLGLLAGYFGGWADNLIMRFLEFIATFPALTILLIISSILLQNEDLLPLPKWMLGIFASLFSVTDPREAQQVVALILVLSLLGWTGTARLTRAVVKGLREQAYIDSARALGASPLAIMRRHILPNALAPLIVDVTLSINGALVGEAALSFLGFGIKDPPPTWGNMLAFAREAMFQHPWLPVVTGLPILIVSLAINYLGDGLRDAFDPRGRR